MTTDALITALAYVEDAVRPVESETTNQNLDLLLTGKPLIDFLLACIKTIAIFVIVHHGFLAYHMYHLAKLDQSQQQMEQKVAHSETSTKISMENE